MHRTGSRKRRVCLVTGTRAEFGLMVSTLAAIRASKNLELQIIATGSHLDLKRGKSIEQIKAAGFKVDVVVPWPTKSGSRDETARRTGQAMAQLSDAFARLESDIVLVVGDRVEVFAAAAAGCIGGRIVAHVHGGDRALGQVDDSLRHAITKLAHVHFPATSESAERILKMGEDRWRIKRVGSPGIDGIVRHATPSRELLGRFQLCKFGFGVVLLHPTEPDGEMEYQKAKMVARAIERSAVAEVLVIAPNNDPGAEGILRCWEEQSGRWLYIRDLQRRDFLGLMRDSAVLIGNSSSGIIEAASFGTPVIDLGDRQKGRERSENVTNIPFSERVLKKAIAAVFEGGRPRRFACRNVYGGAGAGERIARHLSAVVMDERLRRKLIAY
jgi:GDP/UDP-N,N'-diacetylbacillosamine 2-epimerase (hydrolysing)